MFTDREIHATTPARTVALDCLKAGIEAAHPRRVIADAVSLDGDTLTVANVTYDLTAFDDVVVLGGGNAAAHVAAALETALGNRLSGGVVVTDDPAETDRVTVHRGDHPVPSERGVEGATAVMVAAERADERTLVLAVITGGASALLPAPVDAITLDDLQATTNALLESGATIHEINAVRKHLSALKGGQLARLAAPATVVGLVLSDVVGNDLSVIGSGPTVPDDSTYEDALSVLSQYDVPVPDAVSAHLERGASGDLQETPRADDPIFDRVTTHILADNFTALDAAREVAKEQGYDPLVLSSSVRGEAREAAKSHVAVAEEVLATGNPLDAPCVLLAGGECTVTVRGDGEGGPSQEFCVSAALELRDERITVAAVDSDGIDGATDVAGALVDTETFDDRTAASTALRENDVYPLLAAAGAHLHTGATGTNVNDLRIVVVDA
ncbi:MULTISPECIES: glycerate kinase [unclassified Haladaptatus]|uniref:glycerate kinase type-2 family protein n=1 Tax=unclassified Haladaptatus TaxID=2622732 RepID=UPI0023E7CEED|nr:MULTISPECIES: DUF4147 domain-containing protein [unclassified Haladaptatus]